jgi:hypothetical protein
MERWWCEKSVVVVMWWYEGSGSCNAKGGMGVAIVAVDNKSKGCLMKQAQELQLHGWWVPRGPPHRPTAA